MTLWLRTRHGMALVVAMLCTPVIIVIAGGVVVPFPSLGGYGVAIPAAALLPMVVISVAAWGVLSGEVMQELTAARPIGLLNLVFLLAGSVLTAVMCSLAHLLGWADLGLVCARNALGLLGLVLIGSRVVGLAVATALPPAYALAVALAGGHSDGSPRWWAWLIAEGRDQGSWMLALILLAVGVCAVLAAGDCRPSRRSG